MERIAPLPTFSAPVPVWLAIVLLKLMLTMPLLTRATWLAGVAESVNGSTPPPTFSVAPALVCTFAGVTLTVPPVARMSNEPPVVAPASTTSVPTQLVL